MICPKCGRDNTPGTQVCTQCWTSLAPQSAESNRPVPPPVPYPPPPPPPPPYGGYVPSGFPPSGSGYNYQGPPPYSGGSGVGQSASTRAVLSLVLGVAGMFMPCVAFPIAAIVLGKRELAAIARGESPRAGETFARVGYIMGIVFTCILGLVTVIWFAMLFLGLIVPILAQ